ILLIASVVYNSAFPPQSPGQACPGLSSYLRRSFFRAHVLRSRRARFTIHTSSFMDREADADTAQETRTPPDALESQWTVKFTLRDSAHRAASA
ncbi:MAG: hypothetical protein MI923_21430, partial [Phycisphaerales bacterium]|nr:hypothetical protein [Phycisphaerales bacterium]